MTDATDDEVLLLVDTIDANGDGDVPPEVLRGERPAAGGAAAKGGKSSGGGRAAATG